VLVERRDQVWVNELRGAVVVEGEVLGDQLVKRRGTLMADDLVATKGFRVIVPGFHRGELSCYLGVQESEDLPELRPDELRMIEFAVQQLVLELKNRELESAHALITSSVDYAVRIQAAYLPQDEVVHRKLGSVDVWWEPRDKIGGDIWWVSPEAADGSCTVVLADCTGHGVPGAMLSVTVVNLLDQIVRDKPGLGPGQLLGQLDERLREALNQNKGDGASDDGCDAVAVRLERGCNRVKFAGAKLSLVHVRGDGVVERIAGDGVSLGYRKRELEAKGLSEHEVILEAQSTLVLYSDGLTDQIGGENARGVSFGHRRIAEAIGGKIGAQQVVKRVRTAFEQWQGTRPRRDDVALIAFSPKLSS
jgi:serine phosphatase RsbU (regulator of sigma subunit)